MKRDEKRAEKILNEFLEQLGSPAPSPKQMESAGERVLQRLRSEPRRAFEESGTSSNRVRAVWPRIAIASLAAAVIAVVVLQTATVRKYLWGIDARAVVETANGGLFRTIGEQTHAVSAGERLEPGETISSEGTAGAQLKLADGSLIEMHSQSRLSVERAEDGIRIRLTSGSVIVNAVKQRAGHLYVETRDLTVSVVGTVFLVNTGDTGSRVSVVEGEVEVQQGSTKKRLLPGQQLATGSSMKSLPVGAVISWSRFWSAYLTSMEEAAAAIPGNTAAPIRMEFEEADITSYDPNLRAGILGGFSCQGIDGTIAKTDSPVAPKGRCVGRHVTLWQLIFEAYDLPMENSKMPGTVSGGPDWVRTELFDVNAVAKDPSTATTTQLRRMLQTLLVDRFKLKFHPEARNLDGYALLVAGNRPKVRQTSDSEEPARWFRGAGQMTLKGKTSMKDLADALAGYVGPVVDKTDLNGRYDYTLILPVSTLAGTDRGNGGSSEFEQSIFTTLEEELGLRLKSGTKIPMETLVLDSAEKPSAR